MRTSKPRTTTTSEEPALTVDQASDVLNVSSAYVLRLLREKKLPSKKVGRQRRIPLGALMEYKEKSLSHSLKLMQELADEAQELNLGY